jgi:hypothetical protein
MVNNFPVSRNASIQLACIVSDELVPIAFLAVVADVPCDCGQIRQTNADPALPAVAAGGKLQLEGPRVMEIASPRNAFAGNTPPLGYITLPKRFKSLTFRESERAGCEK